MKKAHEMFIGNPQTIIKTAFIGSQMHACQINQSINQCFYFRHQGPYETVTDICTHTHTYTHIQTQDSKIVSK